MLYRGLRVTSKRLKILEKALANERRRRRHTSDTLDYKIMQHMLAKHYGWTPKQIRQMTMRDVIYELTMLKEDIEQESKALEKT